MKSPVMPDLSVSAAPPAPTPSGYAPSVPISVYRELAAELQATQSMLDSLHQQNQQLSQQNQRLRLEIEKVVQVSTQVQQAIATLPPPSWGQASGEPAPRPNAPSGRSPQPNPLPPQSPGPTVTSQEERPPLRPTASSAPADLSGLWFMTTIVLVVVSAFGAGFLIVRPFLPSR